MPFVGMGAGIIIGLLLAGAVATIRIVKSLQEDYKNTVFLTQADIVDMIEKDSARMKTADREDDDDGLRVAIVDGVAYWVADNAVYYAPVTSDDEVDFEAKMVYNAIEADRQELLKLMFILDNLKEK